MKTPMWLFLPTFFKKLWLCMFLFLIMSFPLLAETTGVDPETIARHPRIVIHNPILSLSVLPRATKVDSQMIIRAQLIAPYNPIISSNISGIIDKMELRDGDYFKKNDILVHINCMAQESELVLSAVILAKKEKIYHINHRLNELGSVSELEMAVSDSEVKEAQASLKYHQNIVKRCSISAPFNGKVVQKFVHRFQYVNEGEPILEIIDYRKLEIEMIVPSTWLRWLKRGYEFTMEMDETGKFYPAKIKRISGKIDPVSHSIKVYGQLKKNMRILCLV